MIKKALDNLITKISEIEHADEQTLKKLKLDTAKKYRIDTPRNEAIRNRYNQLLKAGKLKADQRLENLLIQKKVRSLSGVSVVAVLTKPYACKNNCLYCPDEQGMPKSYLSNEPAVMRAIRLGFRPFKQVQKRIEILQYNGHDTSKIELIVMGGTFAHLPKKYQFWFVANCYRAANVWANKGKKQIPLSLSFEQIKKKLELEKTANITAAKRIVGLTLETRPDTLDLKELLKYREMGTTRIEIGVQSIFNRNLKKSQRGHGVQATKQATKLMKDLGYKINYHMMPGLPGWTEKKDLEMFKQLFHKQDFQPDMLKIYPCVVVANAPLYRLWRRGKYRPYTNEKLESLLLKIKKMIPEYVRITRLIRDIPTVSIKAGPDIPNLRQKLKSRKIQCCCIRCREVGRFAKIDNEKIKIERIDYQASGGKEIFLQAVSGKNKKLHAFLRLRKPGQALIKELQACSIIRELHSYGKVAPIGKTEKHTSQHKGLGKQLIKKAEKITKQEFGLNRIAVIAAWGTIAYYRKAGFRLKKLYMVKNLSR
ncbi:MAG: tRNA uridine(34) 5-carboxymethylaminomethyl modification radical SAM/GNAT enzyme Elp3 [Candidatus Moranbacteria bacterium]|nr:tRNA uridine(34) 5-carboxymethylaminomethyl modification radical SAM/GNAT enzyme Elp3 [Candidatus Moranbacteria bacterium]